MGQARRVLEQVRQAPAPWPGLENPELRATVLWALQYDRRPTDLLLLRWLMDQEIAYRRAQDGLGEVAELAGFLVAEHRQLQDVTRHWGLKRANFDAGAGYDTQYLYLFAAGVSATIAYVRESDLPDREALLDYLVDRAIDLTEAELADWFAARRSWFPADETAEDPMTWIDRAQLVGRSAARAAVAVRVGGRSGAGPRDAVRPALPAGRDGRPGRRRRRATGADRPGRRTDGRGRRVAGVGRAGAYGRPDQCRLGSVAGGVGWRWPTCRAGSVTGSAGRTCRSCSGSPAWLRQRSRRRPSLSRTARSYD
ncbi:hypothetical protein [Fodinicola feengrottensis]|uniref:hypothetical protein n=1 Tax=Fodinicola feengrottensis TaxID=435914 RepID=UPI0013D718A2|nr:hypothetical protein [Fodinicola feengrottensis]